MHPNLSLNDHVRRTRDRFSYILVYAPDFPSDRQTNTTAQFEKLRVGVQEILCRTQSVDKRRWLEMTLHELDESLAAYLSGDVDKGLDVLYTAEEHFKNAISGKKHEPTFVADEQGRSRVVGPEPTTQPTADIEERDIARFESEEK